MSLSLIKPKTALISVYDKSNLKELVETLQAHQIQILSSGGTYKAIVDMGYQAIEIAQYTQSPEILGGRVKTLHPKIHAGLLAIRDDSTHETQMKQEGFEPIDLVVVNLYPFEQTIAGNPEYQEAIEQIDIGGPTMLRSGAKNHQYVGVLTQPSQYEDLQQQLEDHDGHTTFEFRQTCAQKVFETTALYDASIATYFQKQKNAFPQVFALGLKEKLALRYGENPHQKATFALPSSQLGQSLIDQTLQGKALSYNNLLDVHGAVDLITDIAKDYTVAILKHTNPCGVARSTVSLKDAYQKALACDSTSAFGGIVVFSHIVDEATAKECTQIFTEIVIAPGYSEEAREVFAKKKNLRLLEIELDRAHAALGGLDIKRALDGFLIQQRDTAIESLVGQSKVVTKREPSQEEFAAMDLAWRVVKHVKSNAIVLTDQNKTLGIGAGQMSRVDSTQICLSKIKGQTHEVLALGSDAFFPFRDSIDLIAKHNVTCVVQPGGSIRDDEVIEAANQHGIAMVLTGVRHFKH
jgi:phosphoribosylaminoimidazolecarboxamide formyltransferase/IMP cyclohydrolase